MTSTLFKIRWINNVKRYGVFATEDITLGTKILEEQAVMINLNDFKKLSKHLEEGEKKKALPKSLRRSLKALTQEILHGMQDIQEVIKDGPGYEFAMKIHQERLSSDEINDPDAEDPALIEPRPWMPIDIYMQVLNIKPTESENDTTATLGTDLQPINTFLHGSNSLIRPAYHAWTPHTRFINHGCKPSALLSCVEEPSSDNQSRRNLGIVTLRSILPIKKDEEITIEYNPAFGTFEQRRQVLRWYGIATCTCAACVEEEAASQQANDNIEAAIKAHDVFTKHGKAINRLMVQNPLSIENYCPADFYQTVVQTTAMLDRDQYHGSMIPSLYDIAIKFAQKYNDNIRLYYISNYLLTYIENAYGTSHTAYAYANSLIESSLEGTLWNDKLPYRDLLTLCPLAYEVEQEDSNLIFMLDHPSSSSTYHLLTITSAERPAPISFEENLALVRRVMARKGKEEEERADAARAALVKEEDEEEAKKEKEARKRKAKKERQRGKKRAAAAAADAAAGEEEEEEKEDVGAGVGVAAAASVSVAAAPPPRPPHLHPSSSCPELAVVARWLADAPLQRPTTGEGEEWWSE